MVHDGDAVAVGVDGDADLGAGLDDLVGERADRRCGERVGRAIGEGAIRLLEERLQIGADALEQRGGRQGAGAVAEVEDDLDGAL